MTPRGSQLGFVCLMVALLLPALAALEGSRGRVEDAAMEGPVEPAGEEENKCPFPKCIGTVVVCIPVCFSPSESHHSLPFCLESASYMQGSRSPALGEVPAPHPLARV
jgi:hypothetical protein